MREPEGPPALSAVGAAWIARRGRRVVTLVSIATLLAMSTWFAASFVLVQLRPALRLEAWQEALVTVAVQLGFALGALLVSAAGLADRVRERHLFALCACGAAAANLTALVTRDPALVVASRFLVGFLLAGVYPAALAIVGTWVRPRSRGWALGLVIGALTLGSALPHLVAAAAPLDWRAVLVTTSVLTAVGAVLALATGRDGPWRPERRSFSLREVVRVLADRKVRLVILAYLGHMWELYAMWAAIGAFFAWRLHRQDDQAIASMLAFCVIGVGAIGCVAGGWLAARRGSAAAAGASLVVSGACALALALSGTWPTWLVVAAAALYGFSVIADSAQFSALIVAAAPPAYMGTALAFQLSAGFALSAVSVLLTPWLVAFLGWSGFFLVLALGPVAALLALRALRSLR